MRSTIVLEFRAGSEDNIREYVAASAPQLGHQMAEVNDVLRARFARAKDMYYSSAATQV